MMLQPGFRLAVAPFFHLDTPWAESLALGVAEPTIEGLAALPPWREATPEERALLVLDPAQPAPREILASCLSLFGVPGHLRSTFWTLLEQSQGTGQIDPAAFDGFAAKVAAFLAFKQLPVPAGAHFELVIRQAEGNVILADSSLWGLINLGEDATSVVFLNLPAEQLPGPTYPPIRLRLAPGQAVRLPAGMQLVVGGLEREQPDVLLQIRLPAR
ncbi:MAG: hypothetical protein U0840_11510 [Gemmataceae bacterium]